MEFKVGDTVFDTCTKYEAVVVEVRPAADGYYLIKLVGGADYPDFLRARYEGELKPKKEKAMTKTTNTVTGRGGVKSPQFSILELDMAIALQDRSFTLKEIAQAFGRNYNTLRRNVSYHRNVRNGVGFDCNF
jgi:hypothetical protein